MSEDTLVRLMFSTVGKNNEYVLSLVYNPEYKQLTMTLSDNLDNIGGLTVSKIVHKIGDERCHIFVS